MNYEYFMEKALTQAEKALSANEFPVGCIIVNQNQVIATGTRIATRGNRTNEIDHAEIIALKQLAEKYPDTDKTETTLFCTMEPCLMCFAATLLSGITRIVYAYEDVMGGGTSVDRSKLPPLYQELKCAVIPHILRNKSLALFKAYFKNAESNYWRDSLLARYTLDA